MNHLRQLSAANTNKAFEIIQNLQITEIWNSFGAEVNIVGSLRMGLLMKHKDIDFHIYSEQFSIEDSFGAVAAIAKNQHISQITYTNLLNTNEKCIEWHAWYQDQDEIWQIDMIHILKESPYFGKFERVADKIKEALTPETRDVILTIKNSIPDHEKIMGIEVYQAVIRDGIKNYSEFETWRNLNKTCGIVEWEPSATNFPKQ